MNWLFSLILLTVFAAPGFVRGRNASEVAETERRTAVSSTSNRLPTDIKPIAYKVELDINLDPAKFTFEGNVTIEVQCTTSASEIILHGVDFKITKYWVKFKSNRTVVKEGTSLTLDPKKQWFKIPASVSSGQTYEVSIEYNGKLSNNSLGLYYSSYKSNNKQMYLAATLFQPTFARFAFPCFDEPQFKAKFTFTILHDNTYNAYSNMPIEKKTPLSSRRTNSTFKQSLKMSTYLAAFVVCDMQEVNRYTGNTQISIISDHFKTIYTTEATDKIHTAMQKFEKYFNAKYDLDKLDIVFIPRSLDGGMESWGLMTTSADDMYYDKASSGPSAEYDIELTVAHLTALQFLGNTATFKWWQDMWLNRGFAMYLQTEILDSRQSNALRGYGNMIALLSDGMEYTHPMINPKLQNSATTPEILTNYDPISYTKSSAVLYMLSRLMGEDKFKAGLKAYRTQHEYSNVDSNAMISVFQGQIDQNTLDVDVFLNKWLNEKGYPLVKITKSGNSITVTQKRFRDDGTASNMAWFVPLTYVTSDDTTTTKKFELRSASGSLPAVASSVKWIKVNKDIQGFYRVNYDETLWNELIAQIKANPKVFSALDRMGLIDDAFALANAGELKFKIAFELVEETMKTEESLLPFLAAAFTISQISDLLIDDATKRNDFKKYASKLFEPIVNRVGVSDAGDSDKRRLRETVHWTMAYFDHQPTITKAKTRVTNWLNNNKDVPKHLRVPYYMTAMRHGTAADWVKLWNRYLTESNPCEQSNLRAAVAAIPSNAQTQQKTFFDALLDKDKTPAEYIIPLAVQTVNINPEKRMDAWKFFKDRLDDIKARVGGDATNEYQGGIAGIGQFFTKQSQRDQVKLLLDKHKTDQLFGPETFHKQMLEAIDWNIKWIANRKTSVETYLTNWQNSQSSSQSG